MAKKGWKVDTSNWTKLGSIPVGDGREAALWIDENGKTQHTSPYAGWVLRSGTPVDPFAVPVPDGTLAFGDLLPGATQVEINAPVEPREMLVAGGQYLALLPGEVDGDSVFAVHKGPTGAVVKPELPELVKREPLTDAKTPCPACGGTTWDIAERRAEPEEWFTRWKTTVCRTCGRYGGWSSGGRRRPGAREEECDDPFDYPTSLGDSPSPATVITGAPFPVYALTPDLSREVTCNQWSSHGDLIHSVQIDHRARVGRRKVDIFVESMVRERDAALAMAHRELRSILSHNELRDDSIWKLSDDARHLAYAEIDRLARARAREAQDEELELAVDGSPWTFTVVRDHEGAWVAAAVRDEVAVTVSGRLLEPSLVRLVCITDPDGFFGGRPPHS